ncbi:hypothetical protein [Brevibacillus choshinensis]|uniref:Uncharacterized protein n=1 Tax=Brevibacillus choshinensis TaxID=54911 RepID=A0ABX7FMS2_BRECH|nr:hypothetical protein [Brevibacillus choshinensis]QRG67155.1 hypothetical protein JNE38_27455 [Brevibacillus choshinensis]
MFQWMWFVRLGKLLPYWIMDRHVKRDANHPSAIVEAHLQTVSASNSLAEAQIHLITQILYELKQTPTTALRLNKLERGLIQMVESIGESMRIMVRLHEHLVMFHHEKNSTVDGPVQVSGFSLLQSIKKLSVQTDGSPLVSNEFIPLLKESVKRLIGSLEGSKNSEPLIFHPDPPLPKPWLNEKIFGHFWKGTK